MKRWIALLLLALGACAGPGEGEAAVDVAPTIAALLGLALEGVGSKAVSAVPE